MSWNLYLPLAGNSINILLLFGLGGAVGFLSGLFGVGGGFLMTPLLIMVGIPSTVAAASDSNQIVAASTSASYAHYRLGNVDFKMGLFLIIGGRARGHPGGAINQAAAGHGQRRLRHQDHLRGHAGRHRLLHVCGEPPEHAEKAGGKPSGWKRPPRSPCTTA